MGKISAPQKAKFFCGLLVADNSLLEPALKNLRENFGSIDLQSDPINFSFTDYYNPEMGENILRLWVSFENLISPEKLAEIKVITNNIETAFASDTNRKVNIDPGYITPANVILASTKNFSHRIYLEHGIYAEVTLIYRHEDFTTLPWSYPDYSSQYGKTFLLGARKLLMAQLKK
jgi:hypothetical protein